MNFDEAVPLSEYARLNKCDRNIIYRAIESGLISDKAIIKKDNGKTCIIPSIADKEWGKDYRAKKGIDKADASKVRKTKKRVVVKVPEPEETQDEKLESVGDEPELLDDEGLPVITATMDYKAALKANEILEAHERKLKVRKMKGELVEKDLVYKVFFMKGQEDRAKFESIPERIIDEILAAKSRNQAYLILTKAIADALDATSKLPKIKA